MFGEAWDQQYPSSQGGLFPHPPMPSELSDHQVEIARFKSRYVYARLDVLKNVTSNRWSNPPKGITRAPVAAYQGPLG